MNNINKLNEQWVHRRIPAKPEKGHQEIIRKSGDKHNKKRINKVLLGAVILILGLFFFYLSTDLGSTAFWGLGIMTGSLVMRMYIEFVMFKNRFPIDEANIHYKRQLISYYKNRKYIHFIITPLWFAAYIYGFVMLLSNFEQELLGEFYVYIIYSSWVVFLGLAVLIGVQSKKELEILKFLIADDRVS